MVILGGALQIRRQVHKEDIKALHLLPPSLWQYLNQEAPLKGC
jgi:hypothetical protein